MLLVYMSLTGNVRNFIDRVGMDSIELSPSNPYIEVDKDYIIVVPSYVGYVNDEVTEFVSYKNNKNHLVAFAASGNLNFDDLYCVNGKQLADKFNKPLIFMFEYSGTDKDIEEFKKEVDRIEITRTK